MMHISVEVQGQDFTNLDALSDVPFKTIYGLFIQEFIASGGYIPLLHFEVDDVDSDDDIRVKCLFKENDGKYCFLNIKGEIKDFEKFLKVYYFYILYIQEQLQYPNAFERTEFSSLKEAYAYLNDKECTQAFLEEFFFEQQKQIENLYDALNVDIPERLFKKYMANKHAHEYGDFVKLTLLEEYVRNYGYTQDTISELDEQVVAPLLCLQSRNLVALFSTTPVVYGICLSENPLTFPVLEQMLESEVLLGRLRELLIELKNESNFTAHDRKAFSDNYDFRYFYVVCKLLIQLDIDDSQWGVFHAKAREAKQQYLPCLLELLKGYKNTL